MKKITTIDRLLLFGTALLAAYQIVRGIGSSEPLAVASFTIAFGVLLLAALLIFVLGFEVLESYLVVVLSSLIPLGISLGLVVEYVPELATFYTLFTILGLLAISISRYAMPRKIAVIVLACMHGVSGLLIFGLPIYLVLFESAVASLLFVSLGGAMIGIGGMLLSFLKAGKPILSRGTIYGLFPVLLFLTMASFVAASLFN